MKKTEAYFGDRAVLITGASSGIGEELAWQLGQAGAKVTLAARRMELLESLAHRILGSGQVRPLVVQCDVTRDGDLERAVSETVRHWGAGARHAGGTQPGARPIAAKEPIFIKVRSCLISISTPRPTSDNLR